MDIHALLDLDRELLYWLNGSDSLFLDGVITALTSGFTWIPLYISLLYLIIKNNETMSQIGLIIGCCLFALILSDGMADFIMKPLVARWRPSNDPLLKYTIDIVDNLRGTQYGFFSAHASNTCSLSIFFCLLVRSKILSVSLVLWSLISCYTRGARLQVVQLTFYIIRFTKNSLRSRIIFLHNIPVQATACLTLTL